MENVCIAFLSNVCIDFLLKNERTSFTPIQTRGSCPYLHAFCTCTEDIPTSMMREFVHISCVGLQLELCACPLRPIDGCVRCMQGLCIRYKFHSYSFGAAGRASGCTAGRAHTSWSCCDQCRSLPSWCVFIFNPCDLQCHDDPAKSSWTDSLVVGVQVWGRSQSAAGSAGNRRTSSCHVTVVPTNCSQRMFQRTQMSNS